jgi:hypothetical protein
MRRRASATGAGSVAAVQLGEAFDEGQADSQAAIGPARHAVNLREDFKDAGEAVRSDSDAFVPHRQR